MNILYLDWPCFGRADVLVTFQQMNHQVTSFFHEDYQCDESPAFSQAFEDVFSNVPFDCCFSYNYYPILATCCKEHNLKYISFVYDSPYIMLYSYTLMYPTNYVFLFDYSQYQELRKGGLTTVYYMVLPVNSDIIDFLLTKPYDHTRLSADISFVGSLYNEKHNLFDRLENGCDYLKGYLEGIMDSQMQISGMNFIEELLTPSILEMLQDAYPYASGPTSIATPAYAYANYFINRKITQLERIDYISAIGKKYSMKLFTHNDSVRFDGVTNMGVADYYEEMPYIFHNSKINLNISLRSIQSGIPLRCMDILGAGGFLLTNYQADMPQFFTPDVDYVYYEDKNDMLCKIDYYLEHDELRKQIAANGHQKAKENHNYMKCFNEILSIVETSP